MMSRCFEGVFLAMRTVATEARVHAGYLKKECQSDEFAA